MKKNFLPGFGWAPNQVINDQDLSLKAKGLWLYLNSKPEGWTFNIRSIAKQNLDGKAAVQTACKELIEKGYLSRIQQIKEGQFYNTEYTLLLPRTENQYTENQYTEKQDISNTILSKTDKENILPNQSEIYKQVIEFLNEKTGRAGRECYSYKVKTTQNLIKARINEGYSLEDFKTVIVNMCIAWGKDSKMQQFLRPSTLFGSKFENYLKFKVTKKETIKSIDYGNEANSKF